MPGLARRRNQHRLLRRGATWEGFAPWNKRRIFARSFIVPRFGCAFIHAPKNRLPTPPLYGPKLECELVKDSSTNAWQSGVANVVVQIGDDIGRMLPQ